GGNGGGGGSYADAGVSRVAFLSTNSYLSTAGPSTGAGSITIAAARPLQTVTFGALADKTYGDAAFTVSATTSSGLTPAYLSLTPTICGVSGATVSLLKSGTCTVQA
ncbi:MAG: hypothetical protein ACKO7U_05515, partial [Actinomycetota bacterium]